MKDINNFIFEKLRIGKHININRYLDHLTLDEVIPKYDGKLKDDSTNFGTRCIKYTLNDNSIQALTNNFFKLKTNQNALNDFIDNIIETFNIYQNTYIKLKETPWHYEYILNINDNGIVILACNFSEIIIQYNHNYEELNFTENYVLKLAAYMIEYIIDL